MRLLLLEHAREWNEERNALRTIADFMLVMRIEEELGGAWSEYPPEGEIIRVGFPKNSRHDFFRVLKPKRGAETCLSVALGRTVFGRQITDIIVREQQLTTIVAHALERHDVRCWLSATPSSPEDFAHQTREAIPPMNDLLDALSGIKSGVVL